jgi:hypothetical protein
MSYHSLLQYYFNLEEAGKKNAMTVGCRYKATALRYLEFYCSFNARQWR